MITLTQEQARVLAETAEPPLARATAQAW